ncbi:MAG: zinc-dependent alcohol dehydrogenase [Bacillota bacterium]
MLALVKTGIGPGNVELKEMPEPSPGPGEVLIEINACGICGTDMHIYHGTIDCSPPVILGHELSGTVVELGDGVKSVKKGNRVTSETHAHLCGHCRFCMSGYPRYCVERKMVGRHGNGGFAKYYVTREERLTILPDNVSFAAGAVTEPLFTVTHALYERAAVASGDVVVIMGPGPMGLLSAQVARALGAIVVVCGLEADKNRLELAKAMGVDVTVNIQKEDVAKIVDSLTGGYGADVAVECSGAAAAMELGLQLLRKCGKFVQIGLTGKIVNFNTDLVVNKGLMMVGSVGTTFTAKQRALNFLARQLVNTEAVISDTLPLSEWEIGFGKMDRKEGLKIVLWP